MHTFYADSILSVNLKGAVLAAIITMGEKIASISLTIVSTIIVDDSGHNNGEIRCYFTEFWNRTKRDQCVIPKVLLP